MSSELGRYDPERVNKLFFEQQEEIAKLKQEAADLRLTLEAVHMDLLLRADETDDGMKIVNLSQSVWDRVKRGLGL